MIVGVALLKHTHGAHTDGMVLVVEVCAGWFSARGLVCVLVGSVKLQRTWLPLLTLARRAEESMSLRGDGSLDAQKFNFGLG